MQGDNNKYQKYFDEYSSYTDKHILGDRYLNAGKKVTVTKYYQILYYKRLENSMPPLNNRSFLIIPSIFNSPEILFLSRGESFIENLRKLGEVFLIDWFEVHESDYMLDDYVRRVVEIIRSLNQKNSMLLDLIGHCMGGNLAIASCIIMPDSVNTLTLLTTPWDFTHLSIIHKMYRYMGLDNHVRNLPIIPKIHIRILFFLLLPNYFNVKLDRFFSIISEKEKDLSFRIEHWLMSGTSLPGATYRQIMDDMLLHNATENTEWQIDNKIIDPKLIDKPVYQIIAKNDQIVPKASILSLHESLRNSTIFEVEGGHISYLINNKADNLFREYTK